MSNTDNFFRQRRDQLRLTQRDIALRLGMTTTSVHKWENGFAPRVRLFDRLAEAYQVSPERIAREVMALERKRQAVLT